jgi:sugar lactone lactonase YvrE
LQALTGNLAANKKLERAEKYHSERKLTGAESLALDINGRIYTGLLNGQIVKLEIFNSQISKIEKLAQIGPETNESLCNDFGSDQSNSHAACGRPMGVRLRGDYLYIADAYHGLFKLNILTGQNNLLLSSRDRRFGSALPRFVNDLDLDNEKVYFIDASYERDVNEAVEEHLEALPRGRLFCYDEKLDKLEFLLENLYFPNGLQLTPGRDAILISENSMSRIIK